MPVYFPVSVLLVGIFLFVLNFISGRKHLLGTLLSLEGVMMMLFGLCVSLSSIVNLDFFLLIFLTFVACEGALALSILVVTVRWWGSDHSLSLSTLQTN